jgi:DNA-binding transcriptional LysR family regulator
MQSPGIPTIDQLRVFLAVVEAGSFAAAGRRLGRATSAIAYTIANLEMQLGIALFDRERTRKPTLADAGKIVLGKARAVSAGVDDLRASVKGLLGGLEPELSLVVDVLMPVERLVDVLQAFEATYPTVKLRLHVEALGAVAQLVQRGMATIGIGGILHTSEAGLEREQVGDVELIPVAGPHHPLASGGPHPPGAARRHRQLVLTVRSTFAEGQDAGVFASDDWRLADHGAKHALLLAGMGWGNMPEPSVRADIAAGRLVRLDIPEMRVVRYPLQAIYRTDTPPGPAGSWMIRRFVGHVVQEV